MSFKKTLKSLLVALIITGIIQPFCGYTDSQAAPLAVSVSNNYFGYILDDTLDFNANKIDIQATGTEITFSDTDDGISDPIDPGFPVKYYGSTYSEIYVSVNGFLSVGIVPQSGTQNAHFPSQMQPDNLIGVFWDDLVLYTGDGDVQGRVYYATGGVAPNRYLVIEWANVKRYGDSGPQLTFEAVLYENGDIHLNYFTLNGDLTGAAVGIEDMDGVDGVEYIYREPGLSSSFSVGFLYPPDGPRLKALPVYQSKFLINEVADYPVRILNTGTVADTYNLTYTTEGAGDWEVRYFDESGAELTDTNADTVVDTGVIDASASKQIRLRITAPYEAAVGSYCLVSTVAESAADTSRKFNFKTQAAVPAAFVQAYNEDSTGNVLFTTADYQEAEQTAEESITSLPALAQISDYKYLLAWDRGFADHTNIEYAILSSLTRTKVAEFVLFDNSDVSAGQLKHDHSPAVAVAPDGTIGLAFIRDKYDGIQWSSAIHLVLLNQNGGIQSDHQITSLLTGSSYYDSPTITATRDNHFVLAWVKDSSSGDIRDIELAVVSSGGMEVKSPAQITSSQLDNFRFYEPVAASLTLRGDEDAFLVYTLFDNNTQTYYLQYTYLADGDDYTVSAVTMGGVNGRNPDVVEMDSGNIVIAWTNENSSQISFSVLPYEPDPGFTVDITTPIGRTMDYVSITAVQSGYGVLTWGDREESNLFYALIDGEGNIHTPPMVFHSGDIPGDNDYPLNGSMGSATMKEPYKTYLPLLFITQ